MFKTGLSYGRRIGGLFGEQLVKLLDGPRKVFFLGRDCEPIWSWARSSGLRAGYLHGLDRNMVAAVEEDCRNGSPAGVRQGVCAYIRRVVGDKPCVVVDTGFRGSIFEEIDPMLPKGSSTVLLSGDEESFASDVLRDDREARSAIVAFEHTVKRHKKCQGPEICCAKAYFRAKRHGHRVVAKHDAFMRGFVQGMKEVVKLK